MSVVLESARLTVTDIDRMEGIVCKLFAAALPGQKLALKDASYGRRLMIGEPVLISETSWSARFILSLGPKDITGDLGFANFYLRPGITWRGRGEDSFSLGNTIQFTHFGRNRDREEIKGFFRRVLELMPKFAVEHKVSFILQEVMDSYAYRTVSSMPVWVPTKCSTNQGENDWSFFLDCAKVHT